MDIDRSDFEQRVKSAFDHIFSTLFKLKPEESGLLPCSKQIEEEKREVAILIQFIGGIEGKIIMSCSRRTAENIVKVLYPEATDNDEDDTVMRDAIKSSLGEMMNILSGKLAFSFQKEYGTTRITTPAMISGNLLLITIYDNSSVNCCFDSRFENLEIILSLC